MAKPALLVVDDETEVLNALNRVLRKEFELYLFSDPEAALEFYRDKPTPLVLSDMRMPKMDGATLLSHISELNPKSKRFLLTGHANINLTVAAVNEGKISHYFAKPWDNHELVAELKDAFSLYMSEVSAKKLLRINKEKNAKLSLLNSSLELEINKSKEKLALVSSKEAKNFARLKKTFNTFVCIYADSIALHNQEHSKHNYRVAAYARYIAEQQGCDKLTAFQIYIAGLLYEAGKLTLPQSMLNKPYDTLTPQEKIHFDDFYQQGALLLRKVDELSYVVEIIKHIPEHYNGAGLPDQLSHDDIPLGARIIAIAAYFDNLIIGRQSLNIMSVAQAKDNISALSGNYFDPQLLNVFFNMLTTLPSLEEGSLEFPVDLLQLRAGWLLAQDLINTSGNVLLTKGSLIEQSHIDKLIELSKEQGEKFILFVQCQPSSDNKNEQTV